MKDKTTAPEVEPTGLITLLQINPDGTMHRVTVKNHWLDLSRAIKANAIEYLSGVTSQFAMYGDDEARLFKRTANPIASFLYRGPSPVYGPVLLGRLIQTAEGLDIASADDALVEHINTLIRRGV